MTSISRCKSRKLRPPARVVKKSDAERFFEKGMRLTGADGQ